MKKSRMDQSSSLGMHPWRPPLNIKNHQESKLGDAQGIPLIFIDYHKVVFVELRFYHFTYYVLCLERIFTFSLFVCWSYLCLDPSFICVGERHAPLFRLNTPLLRLYLFEYS